MIVGMRTRTNAAAEMWAGRIARRVGITASVRVFLNLHQHQLSIV